MNKVMYTQKKKMFLSFISVEKNIELLDGAVMKDGTAK